MNQSQSATTQQSFLWLKISRIALAAYWGLLFVATHVPRVPRTLDIHHGDKLIHASAYAILAILAAWTDALRFGRAGVRYRSIFILLASYGIADELLQIPVGRSAELGDWLADLAGTMLGLAIFRLVVKKNSVQGTNTPPSTNH